MFSSVQEPFKTMPLTTDWSHVGCTKQETDYHIRICGVGYDVNTSRYVGICLSVCLFVCLSVQIHVWPIIFLLYSWSRYVALWPQGRVFDMSSCPTHNFCLVGFWHTIYSTWVYHHERMCCVYSWSQYDPNVKFIGLLTCLCVWATAFLSSYRVTPHLAHECITKGHDLCMTLTFDLNI